MNASSSKLLNQVQPAVDAQPKTMLEELNDSLKAAPEKARRLDIDWLRIIATFLVMVFHIGRMWEDTEEFFIETFPKNDIISLAVVQALKPWHMPLFFVLAGMSTHLALKFRTWKQYMVERVFRLLIPFLFGLFTFNTLQGWYATRNHNPDCTKSFFEFYPDYFHIDGANGYKGTFTVTHLWFIIYLFIMSMACLPLFMYWTRKPHALDGLARVLSVPSFFLIMPTLILIPTWLFWFIAKNPVYHVVYFLIGFFLSAQDDVIKPIAAKHAPFALVIGVLALAGDVAIFQWWEDDHDDANWGRGVVYTIASWCLIVAILHYGRKFLKVQNAVQIYLNHMSMPFYVMHLSVVCTIAYYVTRWDVAAGFKMLIVIAICTMALIAMYEVLVRNTVVLAFLMGAKPLPHPEVQAVVTAAVRLDRKSRATKTERGEEEKQRACSRAVLLENEQKMRTSSQYAPLTPVISPANVPSDASSPDNAAITPRALTGADLSSPPASPPASQKTSPAPQQVTGLAAVHSEHAGECV